MEPRYITTSELAERFRMTPNALQKWRARGAGPPYTTIAGKVLYDLADVEAYERSWKTSPTKEDA